MRTETGLRGGVARMGTGMASATCRRAALAEFPPALPTGERGNIVDRATVGSPADALRVEAVAVASVAVHRDAWADLARRCLEPNVFMDPDFALAAAEHLPGGRKVLFFLVWEPGGRLVAVCPARRGARPFRRTAGIWFHDLMALGAPLLDATCGEAAFLALLDAMSRGPFRIRSLLARAVPAEGPTAALVRRVTAASGRRMVELDPRRRAILEPLSPSVASRPAPRKRKELARQRRRLAGRGALRFETWREGPALQEAIERFLALEAAGWKGRTGTALACDPARMTFARTAMRRLGTEGRCRVEALLVGDSRAAMGVILSSGDRDFFWKMAHDERFAAFSPGAQFVLEMTRQRRETGSARAIDSCAAPDHAMIDRLWSGRLALVDLLVAASPRPALGFALDVARERLERRARRILKERLGPVLAAVRRRGAGRSAPSPAAAAGRW